VRVYTFGSARYSGGGVFIVGPFNLTMSVDISNFSPLKRHSFFLLKWAYYLFFMGLLASPFVLLGVVLAYGTLYGMVWWWYDIF
jgi:hypothetical protein